MRIKGTAVFIIGTAIGTAALTVLGIAAIRFASPAASYVSSLFSPHPADCARTPPALRQKCWQDAIERTYERGGLDAAFDALAELFEREKAFADTCHGNTHALGESYYRDFARGGSFEPSPKASSCGFGFYHGFLIAFLADGHTLPEARALCEEADRKLLAQGYAARFACFHGLGHGVSDGTLPGERESEEGFVAEGLRACAGLGASDEEEGLCASGVFNSLAIAENNGTLALLKNPKDPKDPKDPYRICRRQTRASFKRACYDQRNTLVQALYPSFPDALAAALRGAEASYAGTAVRGLGLFAQKIAEGRGGSFSELIKACAALPGELPSVCVRGLVGGIIEFGGPREAPRVASRLCAETTEFSAACFGGLVERSALFPENIRREICREAQAQTGELYAASCPASS